MKLFNKLLFGAILSAVLSVPTFAADTARHRPVFSSVKRKRHSKICVPDSGRMCPTRVSRSVSKRLEADLIEPIDISRVERRNVIRRLGNHRADLPHRLWRRLTAARSRYSRTRNMPVAFRCPTTWMTSMRRPVLQPA